MIEVIAATFVGGAVGYTVRSLFRVGAFNDMLAENEALKAERYRSLDTVDDLANQLEFVTDAEWLVRADRDRASDAVGTLQRRLSDIADAVRNQKSGTARKILRMAEGGQ